MILTKSEAERILSKVFEAEITGQKVTIDVTANVQTSGVPLSAATFNRIMLLLAKVPAYKIDAIKLYRECIPGTGLAEAKQAVEDLAIAAQNNSVIPQFHP